MPVFWTQCSYLHHTVFTVHQHFSNTLCMYYYVVSSESSETKVAKMHSNIDKDLSKIMLSAISLLVHRRIKYY